MQMLQQADDAAMANALRAQKQQLAEQVIKAREGGWAKGQLARAFRNYWIDRLLTLPVEELELLALGQGDPDLTAIVSPDTRAPDILPTALGDSGADLVFTKLAPSRIADTRNAGGPITGGAPRSFEASGPICPPRAGSTATAGSPTERRRLR